MFVESPLETMSGVGGGGGGGGGGGSASPSLMRMTDLVGEDGALRNPIGGLFPKGLRVVSFEDAARPVLDQLGAGAANAIGMALKNGKQVQRKKHPEMTVDECAVLTFYTMEAAVREESGYFVSAVLQRFEE